ncbi:hypothetical protein DFH07DRAFT_1064861 [Mycena maculata]|uniref:Uncharacterized protein n=1 Tax=Mycena maculata TaxID=230809 RepID=A0AAD7I8T5_9AGAR|nr:hypothetical protein DFH07DRAFT_1064861 [Mycena maculata]
MLQLVAASATRAVDAEPAEDEADLEDPEPLLWLGAPFGTTPSWPLAPTGVGVEPEPPLLPTGVPVDDCPNDEVCYYD